MRSCRLGRGRNGRDRHGAVHVRSLRPSSSPACTTGTPGIAFVCAPPHEGKPSYSALVIGLRWYGDCRRQACSQQARRLPSSPGPATPYQRSRRVPFPSRNATSSKATTRPKRNSTPTRSKPLRSRYGASRSRTCMWCTSQHARPAACAKHRLRCSWIACDRPTPTPCTTTDRRPFKQRRTRSRER